MVGMSGSDTYFVDDPGDVVDETFNGNDAGGEEDTVYSNINSYTLPAYVEDLYLGNYATGIGNGLNNVLNAEGFNDSLVGLTGNDTLYGGYGDDTLDGGTGVGYILC
jgi:Ca2+-binding RTX toxin-like protein